MAAFTLERLRSARAKVLLVLLSLNLLISVVLTFSIYKQLSEALFAELDGRLQTAAAAIPYILPPAYIDQALAKPPVLLGDYVGHARQMAQFAQQSGLRYVYLLALINGRVVYLADSAPEIELAAGKFGHFMQPYADHDGRVRNTLLSRENYRGVLHDAYGDFRSILLFRTAADGTPYLLRADMEQQQVQSQLWWVGAKTIGLGLALLIIGSALSWLLASRLTAPLRHFSHAVQRFTLGEFDIRMPVHSYDELGNLATAFNAMGDAIHAREHLLKQLAFVDRITGLANRTRFVEEIDADIRHGKGSFAVVLLNLADFHYVNDCFGFAEGDNVLRTVADRLQQMQPNVVRQIGRVSGNDFLLQIPFTNSIQLNEMIVYIEQSISAAIAIDEHRLNLAMRFGLSCHPLHATDAEALLRQAEIALFSAKEHCQLCVCYDPSREVDRQNQFRLMGDLREAIDHNQLVLHFQPKLNMQSTQVHSVEALVRWQHPQRGWIPPGAFIAFAEQSGKLRLITEWVIKAALAQQVAWQAQGLDWCISVNVGVADVEDPLFIDFIETQIRYCPAPVNLCLEITETGVMRHADQLLQNLLRLRQLGVKISMDDFGTGYSSFAYLAKMPINELKIDQSFVMSMSHTFESISIVSSMIELGHILGLTVVAEGVETLSCWQALSVMGCDEVQGYFIAKPMAAEALFAWQQEQLPLLNLTAMPNMSQQAR